MTYQVWHDKNPDFGWSTSKRTHKFPDDYEHVANVEAQSLDQAFRLTNHMDDSWQNNAGVSIPDRKPEYDPRDCSPVTFGKIKLGGYFLRNGRLWKRQHGLFGIPVDQIGTGAVGWPISKDEVVLLPNNEVEAKTKSARSTSVGDVVVDSNGEKWQCGMIGWTKLQ